MKRNQTSPAHEDSFIRDDEGGMSNTEVNDRELGIGVFSMEESWIKLHRKILGHWVYTRPEYLSIWVYLLVRANWKPSKAILNGRIVTIERGEVLTSIRGMAEGSHTTQRTVRTFLTLAQQDEMIELKSDTAATRVKILNYNRLQEVPTSDRHTPDTRATHGRHTPDTIIRSKEVKKVRREEDKTSYSTALSSGELIAELRQNDGGTFPIHAEQVTRWAELYPAVDVIAELRKMMGWLDANPTKRKTRSGMMRFATNWLSKQQDKGGSNAAGTNKRTIGDRVGSVNGVSYLQRIAETTQRITTTKHVSDGHGSRPTDALAAQSQDRGRTGADGIHYSDAD